MKMQENLTDDRIFGVMTTSCLKDYLISEKTDAMRRNIEKSEGRVLVIGVGAALVWKGNFMFIDPLHGGKVNSVSAKVFLTGTAKTMIWTR